MTGYMNADGSALVGGKLPNGIGEALNLDSNGNLLVAQAGASNNGANYTSSGSTSNDGDTVSVAVQETETALVQVLGTFNMSLLFEASPDNGTTWYNVAGVQGTSTIASSATAPGYWRVNVAGFTHFRARAHPVTSGTANVLIRLTQAVNNLSIDNAQPLGQQNSANSSSVVIASDQTVPIKGGFSEIIGNGTGVVNALNTDLISSTDVSAYKWLSLQIQGTYSATLSFQASNDNVNWVAVKLLTPGSYVDNNATTNTSGSGLIFTGPVQFRYLRVRATAFTSNTSLAATLELYAEACSLPITNPTTLAAATSIGIGTNDYHLISAASTNANNVKAGAGQIYGYEIGNNGASDAYVKLYNTAGTPTAGAGTPLRVIYVPKGSRASLQSATGLNMSVGIGLTITGGAADADTTAVAANQVTVEIDYK
ncbi:MAG TPA: hypothetical protein VGD98_23250 [Ktedonobacteraceae bacterium]